MAVVDTGQPAPDFLVVDQHERPVTLSGLLGRGPVVLVFYRGHWCPFCRRQLSRLQASLRRFEDRGAQLVAVSIDAPVLSRALADELGLEFTLLCDTTSAVVDLYGVRNRLLGIKSGIPHPAVFIIDAVGIVRFREVRHNYRRRISASRILRNLDLLQGAKDEV
jgi:peroxiredoxin